MRTAVKICCMASVDEARTAIRLGASAIGLVSRMPSGPGPIEEQLIAEIVSAVDSTVETFLLTCETTAAAIIAQQRRTGGFGVMCTEAGRLSDVRPRSPE